MRRTFTRAANTAVLVTAVMALAACQDGRPGRNHPRDRDHHGDHDHRDAPRYR